MSLVGQFGYMRLPLPSLSPTNYTVFFFSPILLASLLHLLSTTVNDILPRAMVRLRTVACFRTGLQIEVFNFSLF